MPLEKSFLQFVESFFVFGCKNARMQECFNV